MYILINALKNIRNSPIRNLLIGAIIAAVATICCISLSLLGISNKAEEEAMLKISIPARIVKGSLEDSLDASNSLTYEEITRFLNSEYVYDSYISARSIILFEEGLGDFTLVGYNSREAAEHFLVSNNMIVIGDYFGQSRFSNECLVSVDFSLLYGYSVGDIIVLESDGGYHQFEITGLYRADTFSKNNIITNIGVFESVVGINDQTELSSVFIFNNPDYIDSFKEFVAKTGSGEEPYRVFFTGVQEFREYFSPIKNTKTLAILSLILALFIGGGILIVISIFNIQERKYEVGVLSSIGMPKKKVATMFVAEALILTSIVVLIGIVSGGPLSVIVSRSMLSPKMYTGLDYSLRIRLDIQEEGMRGFNNIKVGYMPDENSDEALLAIMSPGAKTIDKLKAVINLEIVIKVMGVGLLLAFVSSLGSIIFVVKFKPLEILSDRK